MASTALQDHDVHIIPLLKCESAADSYEDEDSLLFSSVPVREILMLFCCNERGPLCIRYTPLSGDVRTVCN